MSKLDFHLASTSQGLKQFHEDLDVSSIAWNDSLLVDIINEPYKSWGKECGIDRCLDSDNNIMFLHLGRGTVKFLKTYNKFGKKTFNDWIEFIEGQLL